MSLDKTSYEKNIKDSVNLSKESANTIKQKFAEINSENVQWAQQFTQQFAEGKMSFEDYKTNMDAVRSSMSEVNNEMQTLGLSTEDVGNKVEKNIGVIALNSFVQLGQAISSVGKKLLNFFTDTIDYADNFSDLSAQYDISTKSLQEFDYISSQTSTDISSLLSAMTTMYNKAKENASVFQEIGVNVKDANGNFKSMDTLFWEVKRALDNVDNSGNKTAYMLEIFGKQATSVGEALRTDTDTLEEMAQRANDLGIVLDETTIESASKFNDLMAEMELRGKSAFANFIAGAEGSKKELQAYINDMEKLFEQFIPVIADIGLQIGVELIKGIGKGIANTIGNLFDNMLVVLGKGSLWGEKTGKGYFGNLSEYLTSPTEWFGLESIYDQNENNLSSAMSSIGNTTSSSSSSTSGSSSYLDNSSYNIDITIESGSYSESDAKTLADMLIKEIATQKQASGR